MHHKLQFLEWLQVTFDTLVIIGFETTKLVYFVGVGIIPCWLSDLLWTQLQRFAENESDAVSNLMLIMCY